MNLSMVAKGAWNVMKDMSVGKQEMHVRVVHSRNAQNRLKKNKVMGFPTKQITKKWAQDGVNYVAIMIFLPLKKEPINIEKVGDCTQVREDALYSILNLLT